MQETINNLSNPFEKYKLFNIFPTKMVLSVVLVLLSMLQILLSLTNSSAHINSFENSLKHAFLEDDDDFDQSVYVYTIEELVAFIRQSQIVFS